MRSLRCWLYCNLSIKIAWIQYSDVLNSYVKNGISETKMGTQEKLG